MLNLATFRTHAALFALVLAVYLANNRVLAEVDCVPAPYTAWAMVRHGSIDVRRYPELARFVENHVLWTTADGGWVSIRPIGSTLAALPFVAPLAIAREQPLTFTQMLYLGKIVAAVYVAAAAVLFWTICRRLTPESAASATALFAFGTVLWTVASQALWTHGPATLGVTLGLAALLVPGSRATSSRGALIAGLSFAFAILCREATLLFAIAVIVSLAVSGRRRDATVLAACVAIAGLFIAVYNQAVFGHMWLGGYANDNWDKSAPLIGITGLLIAPSRGVLVYSPALVICFYGFIRALSRERFERTLIVALTLAALGTVAVYGSWYDWRGGWSYGPRFLAETMPVFCLLFALGYAALGTPGRRMANVLVALSVVVQILGITGYSAHAPWHQRHDLDDQGRSLFSIHDTEIAAHARAAVTRLGRLVGH